MRGDYWLLYREYIYTKFEKTLAEKSAKHLRDTTDQMINKLMYSY